MAPSIVGFHWHSSEVSSLEVEKAREKCRCRRIGTGFIFRVFLAWVDFYLPASENLGGVGVCLCMVGQSDDLLVGEAENGQAHQSICLIAPSDAPVCYCWVAFDESLGGERSKRWSMQGLQSTDFS